MKIFIVRHGQTYANVEGTMQGQIDTELTELGVQQAKNVAQRLRDCSFARIFSSDLQRASKTAEEIAKHQKVEVVLDKRLRERCFGDWGGKKRDEVDFSFLREDILNNAPPNGEPWGQVVERVNNFLDDLDEAEEVLLVSHNGTMRVLLHLLLGKDLEQLILSEAPKNTCVYAVEKRDGKFVLTLENCDKHNN